MVNPVSAPHLVPENPDATPETSPTAVAEVPSGDRPESELEATSDSLRSLLTALRTSVSSHQDPGGLEEAAQEFEALLMAQILRMSRQAGSGGWLGSQDGKAANPTLDLAESQLARVLAQRGVLGIPKLLAGNIAGNPSTTATAETQGESSETPMLPDTAAEQAGR